MEYTAGQYNSSTAGMELGDKKHTQGWGTMLQQVK